MIDLCFWSTPNVKKIASLPGEVVIAFDLKGD